MFHPPPFPGWASGLLTGNPARDSEHRLLLNTIGKLHAICPHYQERSTCEACPGSRAENCHHELVDTLGDLLAFLVDHFLAEEQAMKESGLTLVDKELCDRHKQDHAAISETVLRIVAALDLPHTVRLIKELHEVLQTWLKHHFEMHHTVPAPGTEA